jgi:hypothetical protein
VGHVGSSRKARLSAGRGRVLGYTGRDMGASCAENGDGEGDTEGMEADDLNTSSAYSGRNEYSGGITISMSSVH